MKTRSRLVNGRLTFTEVEWTYILIKDLLNNSCPTDNKIVQLRGRLTERLLAQGLLTPNMLQELKKEWDQSTASNRFSHSDDEDDPSPCKKRITRIKRTKK